MAKTYEKTSDGKLIVKSTRNIIKIYTKAQIDTNKAKWDNISSEATKLNIK